MSSGGGARSSAGGLARPPGARWRGRSAPWRPTPRGTAPWRGTPAPPGGGRSRRSTRPPLTLEATNAQLSSVQEEGVEAGEVHAPP
eukprot:1181506-Prorocentrum_minimum.AAC.2